MKTRYDLTLDQGANFEVTLELLDSEEQPIDITGANGAGSMRKHYTSTNAISFSVGLDEANSEMTLSLTAAQTANISPGRYVYDVKITYTDNVADRIIEGIVTVTPSVTRG